METSHKVEQLQLRAEEVLRIIDDGAEAIAGHGVEQWKAIALARFQMLRALGRFISYKEEELLLPFVLSPDDRISNPAKIMRDRNHDLQDVYDKFVRRWVLSSPSDIDDFYRADAKVMAEYIKGTIRADVDGIIRLFSQASPEVS